MTKNSHEIHRGMPADAPQVLEMLQLIEDLSDGENPNPDNSLEVQLETPDKSLVTHFYPDGMIPPGAESFPVLIRILATLSITQMMSPSDEPGSEEIAITRFYRLTEIGGDKHLNRCPEAHTERVMIDEVIWRENQKIADQLGCAGPANEADAQELLDILKNGQKISLLATA